MQKKNSGLLAMQDYTRSANTTVAPRVIWMHSHNHWLIVYLEELQIIRGFPETHIYKFSIVKRQNTNVKLKLDYIFRYVN